MRSKLTGDREIMAAMRQITSAVTGKDLDETCIGSLEPLREQTVENAKAHRQPGRRPKGGHLDEGVVTAPIEKKGRFRRVYWVTFRKRARHLAHLVENGTAPHWQPNYRGGWMHPGARPFPFFRPAYDQQRHRVIDEFGRRTWVLLRGYALRATKARRR